MSSAAPTRSDTTPIVAELARVEMRLMAAERRISELERERQLLAVTSARSPSDEAPDTEQVPGSTGSAPTDADRRSRVDAAFAGESVDPAWKPEAAMRSVLNELLPQGSSIAAIDCRHSLCRVETLHPSPGSQQQFVQAVGLPGRMQAARPFAGALFDEGAATPNGHEVRSVTYFTRPGFELP